MTKYKHLLNSDLYNISRTEEYSHLYFTESLQDLINLYIARLANTLELHQEFRQNKRCHFYTAARRDSPTTTLSIRGTVIVFCHFTNKETLNMTWHTPFKHYAISQENKRKNTEQNLPWRPFSI